MSDIIHKEATLNYVMGNPKNIRLALNVLAVDEAIRKEIIDQFLNSLKLDLEQRTSSWQDQWVVKYPGKDKLFDIYFHFSLEKKEWDHLAGISLEFQASNAQDLIVGVAFNMKKIGKIFDTDKFFIQKTMQENGLEKGRCSDSWPYYIYPNPYQNWRDEKTLYHLVEDKEEVIRYFSDRMIKIAELSEYAIDDFLQRVVK